MRQNPHLIAVVEVAEQIIAGCNSQPKRDLHTDDDTNKAPWEVEDIAFVVKSLQVGVIHGAE
jgi:hypothetical protein